MRVIRQAAAANAALSCQTVARVYVVQRGMSAIAVLQCDHGGEFTPTIRALGAGTLASYVVQSPQRLIFGQYGDDIKDRW
jgi:hypothetical protein